MIAMPMSLSLLKIIAGASVFALILISGLLPLRIAIRKQHLLHLGDAFAGGIFLSAGLLHLLPEAEHGIREFYSAGGGGVGVGGGGEGYPLAQLLCVMSFVFLLLLERGASVYGKYRAATKVGGNGGDSGGSSGGQGEALIGCSHKHFLTPYLLLLTLSVHSFIGGAAIGISSNFVDALAIYLAVIIHKGSETIALVSNLYSYAVPHKRIGRIIFLFALLTPLGIFFASLINHLFYVSSAHFIAALFNAIAAGTFVYLGSVHIMECKKSFEDLGEITALVLGIVLMSVVAIWV
jgi:solute carrier family 39 (zinc transporter), member 1/2/3